MSTLSSLNMNKDHSSDILISSDHLMMMIAW